MAAVKFVVPVNLTKQELQNAVIQLLSSDPGSPTEGLIYHNSVSHKLMYYNGTSFVTDTDRSRHTGTQTASTISDFDTQVRTSRLDQMAVPTADVSMNSHKITNVTAGTADSDAANWGQVKSLVNGLDWKNSVVVAVSSDTNTASPGATLDGISMSASDRVLLYGQSTASQNGPWVWNGAASAMTRPTDWVTGLASGGATFPVEQGSNADKLMICTTNGNITVDTTSASFSAFSAGTSYTAGAGLTESPAGTFNVGAGTGITVNADDVAIDVAVVGRKYTTLIGDGSSTSLAVTHSLNNQWVIAQVIEVATLAEVYCDTVRTSSSVTTFIFATAPASNAYRAIIIG